ncbi:hypothetical protein OR1_03904 [Geobacter sp. OR-1]|uniref:exosortase C-terminal domain/associated protein EpsI n=1 Tax=Geobacter sp. OR-1 TaxID=1266765 RepID=UPI000542B7B2|nr:exosortase C-terminal domain/associated protein EpsI [Geobacter sp. OR-1]GAM11588.1 hypothetical protein OR1_03904 [Geobacter sp. OR-1]
MKEFAGFRIRFAIVVTLLLVAAAYIYFHNDITVPTSRPLTNFPVQLGSWAMSGESFMSDAVLGKLKPTDYLSRSYDNGKEGRVTLYIGYHGGGKDGGEIHSPKNCLPGSGWNEVKSSKRAIDVAGERVNSVWTVYQKGDRKELFVYWFQVMGKSVDNEYSLKISEIINSAVYRRRDAAFIRISVPFEADESTAIRKGELFAKDVYPLLKNYLPS